ncbi:MAG: MoaD/ThiS family protein [Aquificota bacterium]|nr:MoaD/ThiS family protein [Aquificota bacterium]MDQ7081858.1 MoaD/ThiS family protein [Aquificota bacterium]
MPIKVLYRGKEIEIPEKRMRAGDLLRRLGLSPLSSIVIRNDEVISEEDYVQEGDRVRVVNAISGGL